MQQLYTTQQCDLCGIIEKDGEWFAFNDEHNLTVCPVCEKAANETYDNDSLWRFGRERRKKLETNH